ncbi:AP-5 complex subunit beta-1 [Poecilia reticulata]|nr:PREDICTED: AP-5 complex subunit beta-1 [Poecilia reticulata]
MATSWTERIGAFCCSPSGFLSETSPDTFLSELLRELRDDRASYGVKVLLLSPLCEYPTLLCSSESAGEETALDLMSVFTQCPSRFSQFRCRLLVALTSVLVCSSCVNSHSRASLDFLDLLLRIAQDASDPPGDGTQRLLRATACDCLREMEASCPGLLSQRLELLAGLRQLETSRLHQAFGVLQILVLRNAVYQLTKQPGAGAAHLKALLGGNGSVVWEADQEAVHMDTKDAAMLLSLILGPMGRVPTLHTGPDCKELRSVLSSLLEESYLLTPLCQAALFHRLTEVVTMVPGIPPTVFRAQLLRLLGTNEVCLLHITLLMKCGFTDSLFSAEDEAFLLKRLVVLSQHPLLSSPEKLFYMDCILHFPENRPISCGDGDEAPPVLLTPRLASVLLPSVFNDSATLLSRLNLQALVFLEEGDEESRGLAYIYDHLAALLHIVDRGGSRDIVVTFFRAAFLFLFYFHHVERYATCLSEQLCHLYLQHTRLAPHILNLVNQTQERFPECKWFVGLLQGLQRVITRVPFGQLRLQDLSSHLKVLARVAEEEEICQRSSLGFLSTIVTQTSSSLCTSGDWRLGNGLLGVCRRVLLHPNLDSMLIPLADILQHLAFHYGDTDIRDHARLYYTLLTMLSREKLSAVLVQSAAEGGSQVKKRTLSCVMAESEGLTNTLTVHQTEKPIFQLSEALPGPHQEAENLQLNQEDDYKTLECYRTQLSKSGFASLVVLKYHLTHTEPHDPHFEQLFSIQLHFSHTDDHYEELQDINVPCLFRQGPPPVVQLTLKPRRPYPTTIHVSAIFTSKDGLTWHTAMPDIHVTFQQVFLPLPAPPTWSSASIRDVFEGLWDEMSRETGESCISLFCCQLGEAALKALVEKHFHSFLVSDPLEESAEFRALLFLPPKSHILLKISSTEDAAHFNMATDDYRLLPHMNSYLLKVTSSLENSVS